MISDMTFYLLVLIVTGLFILACFKVTNGQ
jgi:hypothetical protein